MPGELLASQMSTELDSTVPGTLWVDSSTGDDSNDGLSSVTAFATSFTALTGIV